MLSTSSREVAASRHGAPRTSDATEPPLPAFEEPDVTPVEAWADGNASLRVLVVGGSEQTRSLQRRMAEDGVQARNVSPRVCIRLIVRRPPDLLLLVADRTCGITVLERLRSVSTIGIITLGATDRVDECIQALHAGADDHLSSPFDHDELVARMWAVHRRTAPPSLPLLASEAEQPLSIDLARHEVIRAGRRLHLTSTELRLLELLVAQAGVLLTHEVLLRHVWGEGYGTESNYLRVYVAQLRKKLGDRAGAPRLIETTPGVGYRWIGSSSPVSRPGEEIVDASGSATLGGRQGSIKTTLRPYSAAT